MKTSSQSVALASGACVLLSLIGDVAGLAVKTTNYNDIACGESTGATTLMFGPMSLEEPSVIGEFNECAPANGVATLSVCDADTGETGLETYLDETCTELASEGTVDPICLEFPGGCIEGVGCASVTECTTEEASPISPEPYNFRAAEYNDPNCTDPTGATKVVSPDVLFVGIGNGACTEIGAGLGYIISECRVDGSVLSQSFGPDDTTCSGEVWIEASGPTESSVCATVEVDGMFYSFVSCTTEAAEVGEGAVASTSAPEVDGSTPTPVADDSRGMATMTPTQAPLTEDEVDTTSGAASVGQGVAVRTIVSCALVVAAFVAM